VATPEITSTVTLGDLGSTFGGGPVPCAAALATIEVIERERLIDNAVAVGEYLVRSIRQLNVSRVSGRGLLLGLHLGRPAAPVQQALFGHRILTGTATDAGVLRLLPPLSFSHSEADILLTGLKDVLQ
jgi:acetylornithine/succinyldiaminopimelate/putrescine aminotransferase